MNLPRHHVAVDLGPRSYAVLVGAGLFDTVGHLVAGIKDEGEVIIVSDARVAGLYGERIRAALGAPPLVVLPAGESAKTVGTVEQIWEAALDHGIDRHAMLVALGGGVVGDLTGFAAATLLRGLRLVMLPTTLLAQVDSSVGGKTGFNRSQGKNLVGAFLQPSLVVCDVDTLATLDDRDYRAGLAEVVKYAMILDAALFDQLEARADALLDRDRESLIDVVERCVSLKARVVESDEREAGLRRILNFGHTLGHAVEKLGGFDTWLHGEAVAIGMVAATRFSSLEGRCDAAVVGRLCDLLERFGLPTAVPTGMDSDALAAAMAGDKKADGDAVMLVLCEAVGRVTQVRCAPAGLLTGR